MQVFPDAIGGRMKDDQIKAEKVGLEFLNECEEKNENNHQ